MKFSAQEEYGIRCLLCIARLSPEESLTIPEISTMEALSASHVAKILAILRKAGYITSTRGQLGGYKLAYPASKMVIKDLMEVLGGRLFGNGFCERHAGLNEVCVHDTCCAMRPLWTNIQNAVDQVTTKITVQDLLDDNVKPPLVQLSEPDERKATQSS